METFFASLTLPIWLFGGVGAGLLLLLAAVILSGGGGVAWSLALIGLLLGLVAMYAIYLRAVRGLSRVAQALHALEKGQYDLALPEGGRDQTAALFVSLNHVARELDRIFRLVGLNAGSMTAVAGEVVQIRQVILADAESTRKVVEVVTGANQELDREIVQVKGAVDVTTGDIQAITSATEQLSTNINTIAAGAEEASANINTMASAAEEMTANIAGVNQNLEEVNQSVASVSVSIHEMTASLDAVRRRCQAASRQSEEANRRTESNRTVMDKLSASAREISQVVALIQNIADQTDMLALNAAIEAAGAGQAGKGFAVVANEVKALARQSREATEMIDKRIEEIQTNSREVSQVVSEIVGLIGAVNQANLEIARAVDEQGESTQRIAASMQRVSAAADEVTRNAREMNQAAEDVARAAMEAASGTAEVARSASEAALASEDVAAKSHSVMFASLAINDSMANTEEASRTVQERMGEASRTVEWMRLTVDRFTELSELLKKSGESLYATQLELAVEPPFNIRRLKERILGHSNRLAQSLAGRLAPGEAVLPPLESCELARFLREEGKKFFSAHPAFRDLELRVPQWYDEAKKILQTRNKGALLSLKQKEEVLFQLLDRLYLTGVEGDPNALFFPWSDRLSVGVKAFDDDHKKLVGYVNDLHRAMQQGKSREEMGRILQSLAEYTTFHFGREEKFFAKYNYPDQARHKADHEAMVRQVLALAGEFQAGSYSVGIDLLAFAKSWLTGHILGGDMQYKAFFQGKVVE